MVDLLSRDVVDGGAGGHRHDIGSRLRGVTADIGARRVLNALLALGILGHARGGPVLFLGLSIDD